jgi:predicted esterase
MQHPARFAGAALLSAPLVLPPWKPDVLRGKPVFYGRGRMDPVVSGDTFAAAEAYLDGASGAVVTRRVYDIAHEIDPRELPDLAAWFAVYAAAQAQDARRLTGADAATSRNEPQLPKQRGAQQ